MDETEEKESGRGTRRKMTCIDRGGAKRGEREEDGEVQRRRRGEKDTVERKREE